MMSQIRYSCEIQMNMLVSIFYSIISSGGGGGGGGGGGETYQKEFILRG